LIAFAQFQGVLGPGQAAQLAAAVQSLGRGGALGLERKESSPADGGADRAIERGALDGRGDLPIRIWGRGSYSNFNNDFIVGTQDRRFSGDAFGFNIGADTKINEKIIVGISGGYQKTEIDIDSLVAEIGEVLYTVSPYAAFRLTDALTLWGTAGVGFGNVETTRGVAPITGETDSFLVHASVTLRGHHRFQAIPLSVTGAGSFLYGRKKLDGFSESDGTVVGDTVTNLRQSQIRGTVAYDVGIGQITATPFVEGEWDHDFVDPINGDKGAFEVGGGLRVSSDTGLGGHVQYSQALDRDKFSRYTVEGSLHYEFAFKDDKSVRPFAGLNTATSTDPSGGQSLTSGFATGFEYTAPEDAFTARFELRTNATGSHGLGFDADGEHFLGLNLRKSF
ncbi:MAG: autotransporter outer membrane beta-barrel domain-containing protein, partial [Alphaproteobacteria bacterium]|nr:autotransporter outer membrane beta-barrel domain-containing protein [Alphaproteobacteria bacterium]